jgi:uncharacterized membrane protein
LVIGLLALILLLSTPAHSDTYTPLNIDHVRGVQGRYFVIALPMAAIFVASVINSDLPRRVLATMAIAGSLLSGITSFQALLGAHWSVP